MPDERRCLLTTLLMWCYSDTEDSRSAWNKFIWTGIKYKILRHISLFGLALFFKYMYLILTCLFKKIPASLMLWGDCTSVYHVYVAHVHESYINFSLNLFLIIAGPGGNAKDRSIWHKGMYSSEWLRWNIANGLYMYSDDSLIRAPIIRKSR